MSEPHRPSAPDYGASFADVYDEWYADITDAEATADRVAALVDASGGGPVLELGVGSGRVALPIARRGLDVVGIDSSAAMLHLLAGKEGADRVRVLHADMVECDSATAAAGEGPFAAVVVAFNTFFNIDDAARQQRCLDGVARVLGPDGSLLVEAFVPGDRPDRIDRQLSTTRVDLDRLVLTATEHDPVSQTVTGQHLDITDAGMRLRPWRIRYAPPGEIDEMAERAGLRLAERRGGWRDEPFDDDRTTHVSRYVRV